MTRWLILISCVAWMAKAEAVDGRAIETGRQLFTQSFTPSSPGLNGDGLGPVFNESSCVACHHMGGVGGSGDAHRNGRSMGLHDASLYVPGSEEMLINIVTRFAPGFQNSDRTIQASFPLHRRGGTNVYASLRDQSISAFNPHWNDDYRISSDTVHAERTPREIKTPNGQVSMTVHIFARNTTALFGSGLIDQIPESAILQKAREQRRDPEVSGRPSTLADGRIGRFGWRANFATLKEFNASACSAELGLQSRGVPQPRDFTNATYTNANPDISDDAIEALTAFVASIPPPQRQTTTDPIKRDILNRGEHRFHTIGCVKCHIPNLGSVEGLYSDLLLHDMGPYSADLASAEPYRKTYVIRDEPTKLTVAQTYYGSILGINTVDLSAMKGRMDKELNRESPRAYSYIKTPSQPPALVSTPIGSPYVVRRHPSLAEDNILAVTMQSVSFAEVEPTNVLQEWRTPPLWGLRDTAPYMHDGRAETVLEAISIHDGEARGARNRFLALSYADQQAVLAFLDSFVAPTVGVIPAPVDLTLRDVAVR